MRGFRIYYLDGSFDLINSDQGYEAGTIYFQENDFLVGITATFAEGYENPLKLGFTVIQDNEIYQYPPIGIDFIHKEVLP